MIPETYYGGAKIRSTPTDFVLAINDARLQIVIPTALGVDCILPNALGLPLGGPHFVILNVAASQSMTIKNSLPATIATLTAGRAAKLYLYDNTTSFGLWVVRLVDKRN